jgi:hypothetical protein
MGGGRQWRQHDGGIGVTWERQATVWIRRARLVILEAQGVVTLPRRRRRPFRPIRLPGRPLSTLLDEVRGKT